LLEAALAAPDARIFDLPILSSAELREQIVELNDTLNETVKPFHDGQVCASTL